MTTYKLEGGLQKDIIAWCKLRDDIWSFKVIGSASQESGVPDLLLCKNGKFIAVELKRPDGKGKASAVQKAQLARIKRAGGVGVIIDSFDDFVKLMEKL
jgi:hypothetical protein